MFSLDFSLFHDNFIIVLLLFLSYFIFLKKIFPLMLMIFKAQSLLEIVLQKEISYYRFIPRSIITFRFFNIYRELHKSFFLSECRPVVLNYCYIRNN